MGRRLNLSHLTEEECEQILKVIQKDFDIRQLEKDRLASIEAKVKEEDVRTNILAAREDFNDKYCLKCYKKFLFLFAPKTQCATCKHNLCKDCISFDIKLKKNICLSCQKQHEFLLQSNAWFYERLGTKFKSFGSAKVIRSLYKRKTDSDAESDSGYHPSVRGKGRHSESNATKHSRPNLGQVFEMDEMDSNSKTNDEDEPQRTLSYYKQKLRSIEKHMRKTFVESKGASLADEEVLNKHIFNVSLLLSSMTNELTSHLNEDTDKNELSEMEMRDNESKETISKYVLGQCINHIYDSKEASTDEDHPLGIDPEDLTLRGYIEKLSFSIVSRMNANLKLSEDKIFQQEEEEVRKELLQLSNHARMSQIGKQLSDSELEDLPVTNDSVSDIDGREWQTQLSADLLSANSLLRQEPMDSIDYDESEYDVDESSVFAFASRKKGIILLPDLGRKDSLRHLDVEIGLTAPPITSSSPEEPWTLSANGPSAVMSNRIPIAPYDDYGKKKCGPVETEGDLKMFLPKRHSIEGPMIDNMNVYELSDLSDDGFGSPFDRNHPLQEGFQLEYLPPNTSEHLEVKDNYIEVKSDGHNQNLMPLFVTVPQNVRVRCGEDLSCSCKIDGEKPIDVFWYRDGDELVQIGSDDRCTLIHRGNFHELLMTNCQTSDAGLYQCIAMNEHGTSQHNFTIKVLEPIISDDSPMTTNWKEAVSVTKMSKASQELRKPPNKIGQPSAVSEHSLDADFKSTLAMEINENQKPMDDEHVTKKDHIQWLDHDPDSSSETFSEASFNKLRTENELSYDTLLRTEQNKANEQDIVFDGLEKADNYNQSLTDDIKDNDGTTSHETSVPNESALLFVPIDPTEHDTRSSYSAKNFQALDEPEVRATTTWIRNTMVECWKEPVSNLEDQLRQSTEEEEEEAKPELPQSRNASDGTLAIRLNETSQDFPNPSHITLEDENDLLKEENVTAHSALDSDKIKPLEGSFENYNITCSKVPNVTDVGLPKVDYKRYSQDYEVHNKDEQDHKIQDKDSEDYEVLNEENRDYKAETVTNQGYKVLDRNKWEYKVQSKNNEDYEVLNKDDQVYKAQNKINDDFEMLDNFKEYKLQSKHNKGCKVPNKDIQGHEVQNKDSSSELGNKRQTVTERRISSSMNLLTRRRNYSSQSESDVFEPDNRGSFHLNDAHLEKDMVETNKRSDLDDIVLPSVKLLRLKFSAPRDTSAEEELLRKKTRAAMKVYTDSEQKWKSAERTVPMFPSSHLPLSVVPLQPAPINSRSMVPITSRSVSRTSVTSESKSPQLKSEPQFQKQVIIRQKVVNQSQNQESEEEIDESDPQEASSIEGRIKIRPFSQRNDSSIDDINSSNWGK